MTEQAYKLQNVNVRKSYLHFIEVLISYLKNSLINLIVLTQNYCFLKNQSDT